MPAAIPSTPSPLWPLPRGRGRPRPSPELTIRPLAKAARRTRVIAGSAVLLACAGLLPAAVPAQAAEIPGVSGFAVETGGSGTALAAGDWYTSATGGNTTQAFQITVPCSWPASEPIYIDLYSPEINTTGADVVTGVADNVSFTLTGPAGAVIDSFSPDVWTPSSTAETWYAWKQITPTVCGTYTVRTEVQGATGDDQNRWMMRVGRDDDTDLNNPPPANQDDFDLVPGTGDEIYVGVLRGSFQSTGAGGCLTLFEYVAPNLASTNFRNFGMGGVGSVRYYRPSDTYDPTGTTGGLPGTVSATEATWNGTGDTFSNPESGWWAIVTCLPTAGNQFVQEGQAGVLAYTEQPGVPRLSVTVTDGETLVSRGDSLTWTATVSNTSTDGAARSVVLTAPLPAGMTGASCVVVAPATGTCSVSGGVATATLSGTMVAGGSATVQITSTVGPTASGPLDLTASVAYRGTIGNVFAPAVGSDTDTAVRSADLTVSVSASPDPVFSGSTITYDVSVLNSGPDEATAVSSTFTLASGLAFASASGTGWTCSASGQVVTCTRSTLASGSSGDYSVTATASGISRNVTGTATATTTAADPTSPSTGSTTTAVASVTDLSLTKGHIGTFAHGGTGSYQLTATNDGPSPTSGAVTITDTLPTGLTYVAAAGSGWLCSATGQVVTCSRAGGLTSGETSTLVLTVDVTTATAASVTNIASLSGPDTDPDLSDNDASDVTAVYTSSVSGVVWDDLDGDGTQDAGELGVGGRTVTATGPVTRTTTTSSAGAYSFVGLPPGTYTVSVSKPAKYEDTTTNPRTITLGTDEQVTAAFGQRYVNVAPVVTNDSGTTLEDGSVAINVVANDSDPDGDAFAVSARTNGANGTVSCTATTCTYTPVANFNGTDTFTYTVSDPDGATATATVTVTVTPVNDAPAYTAAAGNTSQTLPVGGTLSSLAATDPDGDPLGYALTGGALPASVTLNPDGSFSGGAAPTGSYTADITVSDGNGGTDVTTLTIQVGGPAANTPPAPANDAASTTEDNAVVVQVLTNDTDVDNDALVITARTNGAFGTVSCTATACTYTPAANANGTDSFTYTVSDGIATATATVTVTVGPVNDAPAYTGAQANTSQTIPVNGTLSSLAATDVDGDPLTYTLVGGALPPGVSLTSGGALTGQATAPGSYSVTIRVSDGNGGTDDTVLAIQVGGPTANTPPDAVNDSASTAEDTPVNVPVTANDSDVDLDTVAVTGHSNASFGTVSCSATACTYTPNANFNGSDSFTYTVSDGSGGTDTATVSITVTPVNDPPAYTGAARNTSQTVPVGGSLQALAATDVEGDTLTFTRISGSLPPGITLTSAGALAGTANAPGTYSVTIRVSDGNGGTDDTALVIQVGGPTANTPPVAGDDNQTVTEDTPGTKNVLNNDSDVDLDTLQIVGSTNGANGAVTCGATTCTYTPNANFNGADSYTYTIADGSGGSDTATVSVTVTSVNDLPVAGNDARGTSEDAPVSMTTLLANDSDLDGDPLTISSYSQPANGSVTCTASACTYTPDANFNGTDTFTYTVSDGNGGTDTALVTVTVSSVNDAPVAGDDARTTAEDTALTMPNLRGNDSDVEGQPLSITGWTNGAFGTVSCTATTCVYTPGANFNGSDSFTYTISDGAGGTDTATVTITVTPVNDAPVAPDDSAATSEDTPIAINVRGNDSDVDGDPLTITSWTQPANGAVTCAGATCTYTPDPNFNGADPFTYTISDGAGGTDSATVSVAVSSVNDPPVAVDDARTTLEDTTLTMAGLRGNDSDVEGQPLTIVAWTPATSGTVSCSATTCVYTPGANFNGSDSFTYTLSDGAGGTDTATVSVTVTPVNDAPVALDNSAVTDEDTPVSVNVLGNDSDVDGDPLTITSWTQPANGSVTCAGSSCTYTPIADYNGFDSYTYTVSDGALTDTATVSVAVGEVNDPPVAVNDAISTSEDQAASVDVVANDSDTEDVFPTVSGHTQGAFGTVSCTATSCTYTPNADFNGSDSFTYTVSDSEGSTDEATVSVTVSAVNDAPVALDDSGATLEDAPVTVDVRANDSDVDGDPLTIAAWTQGANGTVSCAGSSCIYTPDADFNGVDSFTYTVSDGVLTDTATVSIDVGAVNDAPVAVDDTSTFDEDDGATVDVTANDTDTEGTQLSVSGFSQGANGTVTCGLFACSYTPNPNFNGTDAFTYTVTDGELTDTATVNVTVVSVNDLPVADDDMITTNEDNPGAVDVLAGDTDADGNTLSITSWSQPGDGGVTCSGAVCTYTPDADFNGTDSFAYTVSDGNGGTDTATVNVTVFAVNDAPVAGDDTLATTEDNSATVNVTANDTDVESTPLSVSGFTQGANGTVTCGTLTCSYTPNPNFNGTDAFTYTVTDGTLSDTATVTVTVATVNDAPVSDDDAITTNEDNAGTVDVLAGDTDIDGDPLTITSWTDGANGSVSCAGAVCTYTPDADFNGTDSFTYTISDGAGGTDTATVDVTVVSVNDAPVPGADAVTTDEDATVGLDVLVNDSDVDGDTLTIIGWTDGADGTVSCAGPVCTYVPDADANGVDTYTYTVSDGNGGTATGTVTVTVAPVNDAPVAVADTATTDEDTPIVLQVVDNDTDTEGDALTITGFTQGAIGSVTCTATACVYTPAPNTFGADSFTYTISDGNGGTSTTTVTLTVSSVQDIPVAVDDAATVGEDGSVTVDVLPNDSDNDGDPLTIIGFTQGTSGTVTCTATSCTYAPDDDFNGTDSFTYTISDGNGGSSTATVTVTVTPVNDAPVGGNDTTVVVEGGTVTIPVLDNDTDVDGDPLTVVSWTQPGHGSVTCTAAGACTYVAEAGYTGPDSFTYSVSDGNGGTDVRTVNLTVRARPVPPVDPRPRPGPDVDPDVIGRTGAETGSLAAVGLLALLAGALLLAAASRVSPRRRRPLVTPV